MTEVIVATNEITVAGNVRQIDLQVGVGTPGQRGTRTFTGNAPPNTLSANSPFFGGYTEFIPGDIFIERSTGLLSYWEWRAAGSGYEWVRIVDNIDSTTPPYVLDSDLQAIADLNGTGVLKKLAPNTWTFDTNNYLTSNETITLSGDVSGSGKTSIALSLANSGVSSGTYNNVASQVRPFTVDAKGRVTNIGSAIDISIAQSAVTNLVSDLGSKVSKPTSTDNAIARFDGVNGVIQNSGVTIADNNTVQGVNNLYFAGTLFGDGGAASSMLVANANAGVSTDVRLRSGGNERWIIQKTNEAESGSNAGSNFRLYRRADDGSGLSYPITINRATGKITFGDVGSTAGLEFGSSGPRIMVGTGGPSGISAPVGSTWRQTDANASHGSLKGLLWRRVTDPGTNAEGTDWLVDYEGRWIASPAPTWTNVSMSSTTARHTRTGKHCDFTISGTLSAAPTGAVTVTLPLSISYAGAMGNARLQPNYAWPGVWSYATSTSVNIYYIDGSSHYADLSASAPETWASGDSIRLYGTYEIA
jgi:hypothetical protein